MQSQFLLPMSLRGLEPPRITSLEPKPSASTNSATTTWERELELNQLPGAYETPVRPLHLPALTPLLYRRGGGLSSPRARLATCPLTGGKKPGGS
jgi:hypothetical protein